MKSTTSELLILCYKQKWKFILNVKESEEDNPALEPVIEALEQVVKSDTTTSLPELFSPEELLPQDITHFFRYYGSLTTPPCLESVVWTVLKTSIPISKEQVWELHLVRLFYHNWFNLWIISQNQKLKKSIK